MEAKKLNLSYLPADPTPKVKKAKGGKFVAYGTKNDYPDYLEELAKSSPTHGTLVKSKARMVYGNGLKGRGDTNIKIKKFSLNNTLRSAVYDYEKHDGFYLEIILTNKGNIGEVNHVPFKHVRPAEKEDGEIKGYWYNENWKKERDSEYVPAFSKDSKEVRQFLFVGLLDGYFPTPNYVSATNYIELERALSTYFLMHVKNGLHPGFMLVFKQGEPDETAKATMRAQVEKQLMGEENTNKFFIVYVEDDESPPEFVPIEISDPSDQYRTLDEIAPEKIMIAHAVVSPMIFGLKNNTGLGNNAEELETAYNLFNITYANPRRKEIEEGIDPLLSSLGIVADFSWSNPFDVVEEEQEMTQLSKPNHDEWLDFLKDKGENPNEWEGEWELFEEDVCTDHETEALVRKNIERQLKLMKFASADDANPEDSSEWGDAGLYKLRYLYTRAKASESGSTRPFCQTMETLGNQGVLFRYEDIALGNPGSLSDTGENSGFAPKGESVYDIFLYKGGVNCHHIWKRQIYFRKRGPNGQFLPKSETPELENDQKVGNVPYVPQKGEEGRPEIDKPNGGRLNFIKQIRDGLGW